METRIEIVRAVERELEGIAALAQAIWRTVYPGIISEEQIEYMLGLMYNERAMKREFAEGVRYERILADGALVGFAAWGPTKADRVCKLHKLYVLSVWQGRGIGTRAMAQIFADAKQAGFETMTLNVNKLNILAITAYLRFGFVIAAEVCDEIGGGFVMDDYVMTRAL